MEHHTWTLFKYICILLDKSRENMKNGVSYTNVRRQIFPKRCSGLLPTDKGLQERGSGAFRHEKTHDYRMSWQPTKFWSHYNRMYTLMMDINFQDITIMWWSYRLWAKITIKDGLRRLMVHFNTNINSKTKKRKPYWNIICIDSELVRHTHKTPDMCATPFNI
jgi:hypothetical protein